jgi:hypothetical protein
MSPAGPGLAAARRAEAAAYEKLVAGLRELNGEVLGVAAGLSHGTIETVLAKSGLQPRAEALLRVRGPAGPSLSAGSPPPGPYSVVGGAAGVIGVPRAWSEILRGPSRLRMAGAGLR